ncbi:pikC [Symbiodinium natans]|uniref:PikC protein n=1 Tax=Symbiodinium natans TaxID=878477 RepID=A0A812V432_9DINO|nr:pikC [Symbiodinium natans]
MELCKLYTEHKCYTGYAALATRWCSKNLHVLPRAVRQIADEDHEWHNLAAGVYLSEDTLSEAWQQEPTGLWSNLCEYDEIKVEKQMNSITRPWMFQLRNSDRVQQPAKRLILKPEDIGSEACVMEILSRFNQVWAESDIQVLGQMVRVKTYRMFLVDPFSSLVEVVENSMTLERLKRRDLWAGTRVGTRVRRYLDLESKPHRLEVLAATTAGFLACSYLLGIGDGHGDNLMLTESGELFRIDFGFLFGKKPVGLDAPTVWLPYTVREALGEHLPQVIRAAELAVQAVLHEGREELRDICRVFDNAFEGHDSETYVTALAFADFQEQVRAIDDFSLGKELKGLGYFVPRGDRGKHPINVKSPAALTFIVSGSSPRGCSPNFLECFADALMAALSQRDGINMAEDLVFDLLMGFDAVGPALSHGHAFIRSVIEECSIPVAAARENFQKAWSKALQEAAEQTGTLDNGPLADEVYTAAEQNPEVIAATQIFEHSLQREECHICHSFEDVLHVLKEYLPAEKLQEILVEVSHHVERYFERFSHMLGEVHPSLEHAPLSAWMTMLRIGSAAQKRGAGKTDTVKMLESIAAAVSSKGCCSAAEVLVAKAMFVGPMGVALSGFLAAGVGSIAVREISHSIWGTQDDRALEEALRVLQLRSNVDLQEVEEQYQNLHREHGGEITENCREINLAFQTAICQMMRKMSQ